MDDKLIRTMEIMDNFLVEKKQLETKECYIVVSLLSKKYLEELEQDIFSDENEIEDDIGNTEEFEEEIDDVPLNEEEPIGSEFDDAANTLSQELEAFEREQEQKKEVIPPAPPQPKIVPKPIQIQRSQQQTQPVQPRPVQPTQPQQRPVQQPSPVSQQQPTSQQQSKPMPQQKQVITKKQIIQPVMKMRGAEEPKIKPQPNLQAEVLDDDSIDTGDF